ncbi:hypothetical protein MCHI_002769 [Candidatus Magnetoovum chiemensis]|nr:hypothetical protein MCHI_002769 [Candidatus Magnetoovum chiemensis]
MPLKEIKEPAAAFFNAALLSDLSIELLFYHNLIFIKIRRYRN